LVHLFISSPAIRGYFRLKAKGSQQTMPKINQGVIIDALLPLPPAAEQCAIVELVDKIIAMIDILEKQVAERKNKSEMLMQAVLREAFVG
ncbi:MAG: restriction endonuclease subunit S, partial [Gammaproteobacteria bacterium]|nr:restriction endonuclease subunit S [Gammaproteobacteria bacterium]